MFSITTVDAQPSLGQRISPEGPRNIGNASASSTIHCHVHISLISGTPFLVVPRIRFHSVIALLDDYKSWCCLNTREHSHPARDPVASGHHSVQIDYVSECGTICPTHTATDPRIWPVTAKGRTKSVGDQLSSKIRTGWTVLSWPNHLRRGYLKDHHDVGGLRVSRRWKSKCLLG